MELADKKTGERACAVVACADAAEPLGFDEMVAYLKGLKLMVQKIPEQLEIVDAVPRNAAGQERDPTLEDVMIKTNNIDCEVAGYINP